MQRSIDAVAIIFTLRRWWTWWFIHACPVGFLYPRTAALQNRIEKAWRLTQAHWYARSDLMFAWKQRPYLSKGIMLWQNI